MRKIPSSLFVGAIGLCAVLAGCEDLGSAPGPGPLDDDTSSAVGNANGNDDKKDAGTSSFCVEYEATCGWDGPGRFQSLAACEAFYSSASGAVTECAEMHLGLAATDAATHCPHAAGAGPCEEKTAFCTTYEARCGFDAAGYADANACTAGFEAFDATQQACAEMHLDFAASDPNTHCPHARGTGPCAAAPGPLPVEDPFCDQYALTCTFGGPGRFATRDDCNVQRAGMSEQTRKCTGDHLALANSDPSTHCPHATGAGPCDPTTFFCSGYEQACGFSGIDRFTSTDDCKRAYEDFSPVVRSCAEEHVVLAQADPDTHCPHAQGRGPCEGSAAFCSLYTTRCGYGGDERFADLTDCQSTIEEFSSDRQRCVEEHLNLAASDPLLHCAHATGLGPCVSP